MLGDAELITMVAEVLSKYNVRKLVIDPVMVAESGDRLLPAAAVETLCKKNPLAT